ncbi:MAG: hypothetical protein MUF38_00305 [Anaerolineae bacterium]|jgi:hypothetical protein|nr:hypothetical protein [Anaerolineae bacterium]
MFEMLDVLQIQRFKAIGVSIHGPVAIVGVKTPSGRINLEREKHVYDENDIEHLQKLFFIYHNDWFNVALFPLWTEQSTIVKPEGFFIRQPEDAFKSKTLSECCDFAYIAASCILKIDDSYKNKRDYFGFPEFLQEMCVMNVSLQVVIDMNAIKISEHLLVAGDIQAETYHFYEETQNGLILLCSGQMKIIYQCVKSHLKQ